MPYFLSFYLVDDEMGEITRLLEKERSQLLKSLLVLFEDLTYKESLQGFLAFFLSDSGAATVIAVFKVAQVEG